MRTIMKLTKLLLVEFLIAVEIIIFIPYIYTKSNSFVYYICVINIIVVYGSEY